MFSSMPSSGWRTSLRESSCCNWWTKGWFWRNDTFCENGLVNDRLGPHSIIIKERNNCWNSKINICVFKNWVKYKTETKGNPPEPWHSFQLKTDRFNFLSKIFFFFGKVRYILVLLSAANSSGYFYVSRLHIAQNLNVELQVLLNSSSYFGNQKIHMLPDEIKLNQPRLILN